MTDGNEMEDEARRLLSCAVEAESEGSDDDDGSGKGGGGECDGDEGGGN